ncbi:hypothetical protein JZ751_017552 [Albula glossodonta]|uniref:Uncharacterized protein n=1 Tax=Albula glossodonta TaxID=121402 RepID=A0A8T2PLJ3_9TELE|nr:hypothetical protein JZ751_017552 [Albula glossodonta]
MTEDSIQSGKKKESDREWEGVGLHCDTDAGAAPNGEPSPEVPTIQQTPVGGDLGLQLDLDVEQRLVLLTLLLDVVAQI